VATRRRSTSTRRNRSSGGRSYGYRRRRPRTSTTLGGAVALGVIALFTRLSWAQRIGLALVVVVLVVGYELWTRRGKIAADIREQQAADAAQQGSPPPSG
jgi:lysylphosphatidylglycerol synthetase-like protein (DUF2156 family)